MRLFEEIRREYEFGIRTIAGVSKKLKVHRRMVREAVGSKKNTIDRRIKEARLPRVKTLEEFDFSQAPLVNAAKLRELADGGYIDRAEPVLLIGDCGTEKTHLFTGLCVAACRQRRRVRFTTAAALLNELVEAKQQLQLRRVMAR